VIESEIRALLINIGIAKVYPIAAPQDTALPYAVLNRITTDSELTMDGDAALKTNIIQISYFSQSSTDALTKADAIRTALDGYQGGSIQLSSIQNEGSAYEFDTKLYHVFQRYSLIHS
jgi:hypothetical protein